MKLPRVKPEHAPQRFADGTVRIGGAVYGMAAEIRDPGAWVWDALTRMDGVTPAEEVARALLGTYPDLGEHGVRVVLDSLFRSGYVEDVAACDTTGLSDQERERYSRNHSYFRRVDLRPGTDSWEPQRRLKSARVVVLGLGGTGSHASWALAATGVGRIHLVDHDVVEESNLTRQALYTEGDLGRLKAEVAGERLRSVNSAAEFTWAARKVDTEDALRELAEDCDVFALCADEPRNDQIAKMVSRVCAASRTPWVSAGYSGPLTTVGVYGPDGPCYECVGAGEEAKLKPGWTPDIGGLGVLAGTAGISGHLLAHEAVGLITGVSRLRPGYVRGVNLIAPDHLVYVRHPARPDCRICHP
ncbi:HesA/MoeB/ThiF family protein [Streptomyces sp. NPDC020489]|uniref:HesA/MoeB/ThiF family protein n=1 Tax=Streptomyces sp. NPDC020489 TaxID=3365077 RepID=UPI0037A1CD4D